MTSNLKGFNFKFIKKFDLFFNIIPNLPYDSAVNGEINKFKPLLLENRLEDINDKLIFLSKTYEEINILVSKINNEYNDKFLEIKEEWELLHIFTSYFLHVSKSILYLYARVFSILYSNLDLNESLQKQIKKIDKISLNVNTTPYKELIESIKDDSWIKKILAEERKSSMRDLDVHFSSIKIGITPNKVTNKYDFKIYISYGVDYYMIGAPRVELQQFTKEVLDGLFRFTDLFMKKFSRKTILNLLK